MADSEVRQKFEAWEASLLKCVGNSGGCDGDLEGMAHEPNCPLFGKQFATHFDAFAAGMRAGEIAQREKIANQVLDILDELTPQDAEVTEPVAVAYQRVTKLLLDDEIPEGTSEQASPREFKPYMEDHEYYDPPKSMGGKQNTMKLIIELDVNSSDFSEADARRFTEEAEEATGINVEVARPIDENDPDGPFRMDSLGSEYFKVRLITSD